MSATRHVSMRITGTTTAEDLRAFVCHIVAALDQDAVVTLDYTEAALRVDEISDDE